MIPQLVKLYFPDKLEVEIVPRWETEGERPLFRLLRSFSFMSPTYGRIVAPEGMTSNLASTPRILKALIDDDDPDIAFPAVIHDCLYGSAGVNGLISLTRKECDGVIAEGMRLIGAPAWKYIATYQALRIGGAPNFRTSP